MGQQVCSRAMSLREADDGAPWLVTGHRLSPARLEETLDVAGRAGALLGWTETPAPYQLSDRSTAQELLARAWREITGQLVVAAGTDPDRVGELIALLTDLKAADERVRDEFLARQSSAARVVREALDVLRGVDTVAQLTERAPLAVSTIGFDRAVLSRIEQSVWIAETAYVAKDPGWADEIRRAGSDQPRTLDGSLLETQIVRRNRPLVVNDLADRTDLHRALIDTSMTRSYAAAPIVGWGRVIGFLHADCYHQRRNLDATDRDLLWMFCAGLGTLITRAAALDELNRLRGELRRLADGPGAEGDTAGAGLPWSRPAPEIPFGQPEPFTDRGGRSPAELEPQLTRRELDVLRLMSAGRTNGQIARQLVIAEGTVKSHVKHILRKLDAANRAEAVSRWLRTGRAGGSARGGYSRTRLGAT
ncbi:MAG TPA: LuxR C-terminal-related transcriptional regulator [Pseudonocardia sp.]|nr:LuxR C-terminal-related transcriptional regulator [Pseudonocardia sp.]